MDKCIEYSNIVSYSFHSFVCSLFSTNFAILRFIDFKMHTFWWFFFVTRRKRHRKNIDIGTGQSSNRHERKRQQYNIFVLIGALAAYRSPHRTPAAHCSMYWYATDSVVCTKIIWSVTKMNRWLFVFTTHIKVYAIRHWSLCVHVSENLF